MLKLKKSNLEDKWKFDQHLIIVTEEKEDSKK